MFSGGIEKQHRVVMGSPEHDIRQVFTRLCDCLIKVRVTLEFQKLVSNFDNFFGEY